MNQLAEYGTCGAFQEAVAVLGREASGATNGEALSRVFSFMLRNYKNEYVYKSLLLKKIVYGRHSPRTTSAICELHVGGSIADFVCINGRAHVYEIKTDLDNMVRLDTQLRDYYRAFRYVSVVCSEDAAEGVRALLKDSPVGLMMLTNRLTFRTLVEPRCSEQSIDPSVQFDLLRKAEREEVLLRCGIALPEATPVRYYSACLSLFEKIDSDLRNSVFEQVLKERGFEVDQSALALYPEEFKLIAYNHGASASQGMKLQNFAQSKCD